MYRALVLVCLEITGNGYIHRFQYVQETQNEDIHGAISLWQWMVVECMALVFGLKCMSLIFKAPMEKV